MIFLMIQQLSSIENKIHGFNSKIFLARTNFMLIEKVMLKINKNCFSMTNISLKARAHIKFI
jgi:hypothetical protein